MRRQNGNYIYNQNGKKYLDLTMGWCVGNFGWNNLEIKTRVQKFDGPDYVSPDYIYKPWTELAQRLARVAPGRLKKSFRSTGGTESVELALQAAMRFTERSKIISLEDAYHGDSLAALSIGSPDLGKWYRNHLSAYRIKPPLDEQSAERVEKRLSKRDIAAVIMEPIICNRGVMIPDQVFMTMLQASCRKHGTLLIIDEVATGFWRTGKLFGTEHFDIEPDILCLGKAITGGFAPMGAMLATGEVAEALSEEDSYYSTYGRHPRSVEAALATLDYIERNEDFLKTNIREMGNYLVDQISTLNFKSSPTIRMKGLAIGVGFKDEDYGEKIVDHAKNKGLLISEGENGFSLFPALTIDRKAIDEAVDILQECV
ncbi:aspartate aminotransferase family protein [Bdellovibrio sp. HCB185ZH]|uniref:class-III pyridoxal-phosphate-dependent aminotransferase n=1 Tax=Bdellovibrio sp. HCB185ZH TaxID=3394235 RepID=UPI0039A7145B